VSGTLLELENVRKTFRGPGGGTDALRGVSLALEAGQFGVVAGPSGSGKTTLLMIAGLLQSADGGRVSFDGRDVSRLGDGELAGLRKHSVGMVFQKFCLMPHRSALANVEFRFRYLDVPAREVRRRAADALERVGLAHKAGQAARLLSAGEMQRVAIARALALPPKLLLADEPTGNLDAESARAVMDLLGEANRAGTGVLLVTHDPHWVVPGAVCWRLRGGTGIPSESSESVSKIGQHGG
jgi:putative ABC transport system ATP-binding protein